MTGKIKPKDGIMHTPYIYADLPAPDAGLAADRILAADRTLAAGATLAVNPYPRYRSLSRSLFEGKVGYEFETSSEGETRQRGLHVSLQWDCMLAGSTGARYSRTKEYPLP